MRKLDNTGYDTVLWKFKSFSLPFIITIIAIIIIIFIRQLGIEILLLLTIAQDWFSLCLLIFLFSYTRDIARLRKTEMTKANCH